MIAESDGVAGAQPLDVFTPLRSAREHATKSLVAWIVAGVGITLVAAYYGQLLGWPTIDYRG